MSQPSAENMERAELALKSLPPDVFFIHEAPCGCCNGPWIDEQGNHADIPWLAKLLDEAEKRGKEGKAA
jgi:hypothetical protein